MTGFYYKSRNKVEKKDWQTINRQRRFDFVDAVEKAGTIGQAHLKNKLGWGDGVFERTKRDVLELYKEDINFNSRSDATGRSSRAASAGSRSRWRRPRSARSRLIPRSVDNDP